MEDLSPIEEDVNFKEMYHVFLPQEFRETSASTVYRRSCVPNNPPSNRFFVGTGLSNHIFANEQV